MISEVRRKEKEIFRKERKTVKKEITKKMTRCVAHVQSRPDGLAG
jgi:hypothetical protein